MSAPLANAHIVVGVSGGIAAYKAAELCRLFDKAGAKVSVVMSAAARKLIGPLTFQALTGRAVTTDLFNLTQEHEIGHIHLADVADAVVIAPATANTIARLAAGLADDALTAVCLATRAPMVIAPAMNVNMWQNPVTQRNVNALAAREAVTICGPGAGFLACRWTGPGRMAEPADIVEATARAISPQDLAARRVVVTAGPTREAIDPVRFLSNRSSGKMGVAIARQAARRGAEVTLVAGPMSATPPPGIDLVSVETAVEMDAAVKSAAASADVVIMAAAVADFRPAEVATDKLKKQALAAAGSAIGLAANPDILAALGAARQGRRPLLVGFAAETASGDALVASAREKLVRKRVDLICANDVSAPDAGFASDQNRVVLVDADSAEPLSLADKDDIASAILDRVARSTSD